MTIAVKVIADSISPTGQRLTTLQARYPRIIHSEFMTHRVFSRNASSSRAIPVERMIEDVLDDPAMPVAWGSNKPGMQAGDECTNPLDVLIGTDFYNMDAFTAWGIARDQAVQMAGQFARAGYHKQIVNRLLEPFAHISLVVTATEWQNFFDLRCHEAADPTMRALAEAMRDAMTGSEPDEGNYWHLPYISEEEWWDAGLALPSDKQWDHLAKISAARCARVSFLNHDGSDPDIEKDLKLADMLLKSRHMSPFEHQARVTGDDGTALWGNFVGWDQFRKMVE